MNLQEVRNFFLSSGLSFSWLADAGRAPMKAIAPKPLELDVDVSIVIPDVHLGVGFGDAFQESDRSRVDRLEGFLEMLTSLRDDLASRGAGFAAVQLGDFYDVMRTSDPLASFGARLEIVLDAYPEVMKRVRELPLLHCLGNHDHELYKHRTEIGALGISAHIVRAIGPRVIAFHGNDMVSLADVELDDGYQRWLLALVQSLVEMPIGGGIVEVFQRYFDDSVADPIFSNAGHTSLPWKPASGASTPLGWSAPWVVRDGASQLGTPMLGWERRVGKIDLAIIGHSHRPGIGFTEVDLGRTIPVIDVGSWTYGRTNFAVVCSEGVGIASLD